ALGEIGDETLANGLARALSFNNSFVRQKATQVVGYYATDMQMLATLQHMVANDPAEEMRTAACEAAEKYANKLRYFT
ncbi:MAG: HEAT repeat domain-containing protein, partial [bacterium]